MYSILKPPKTGNCQILDSSTTKLTIRDIKEIFKSDEPSEKQKKIEKLKNLLDIMVTENNWNSNVDLVFEDHNYCKQTKAAAKECVIYYICGYLSKQIQKHTKCKICLSALKGAYY